MPRIFRQTLPRRRLPGTSNASDPETAPSRTDACGLQGTGSEDWFTLTPSVCLEGSLGMDIAVDAVGTSIGARFTGTSDCRIRPARTVDVQSGNSGFDRPEIEPELR